MRNLFWLIGIASLFSIFSFSEGHSELNSLTASNSIQSTFNQGEKITEPKFTGVSKNGSNFSIRALAADLDNAQPNKVHLDKPTTFFDFINDASAYAQAGNAQFIVKDRSVTYRDNVTITTTTGYKVSGEEIILLFAETASFQINQQQFLQDASQ